MRRHLIGIAIAVVVGLLVWRRDGPAGEWSGKTTQGRPMWFRVVERKGKLVLDRWGIVFEARCERSGRTLSIGIGSSKPADVVDGRWEAEIRFFFGWGKVGGAFVGNKEARGVFDGVLAALDGEEMRSVATEKCTALDLVWTARPGRARAEGAGDVDLELTVDADGKVTSRIR